MLDVEDRLTGDDQIVVEGQRVLGEVDHPLDRVLDRDETQIHLAAFHGVEHVRHRPIGQVLGPR